MRHFLLLVMSVAASLVAAGCASTPRAGEERPTASAEGEARAEGDASWRATMPEPGEPPELVTPTFEKATLDNGLAVYVAERRDLPLVAVNVAFLSGSAADPDGKAGLAEITFDTLLEGAGGLDALELDEAFADLGTSPYVSVGQDGALVGTQVLRRNLEEASTLLADIVLRPQLRPESFERRKQQQLADLARMVGSPGFLASEAFAETIYGEDHPYGNLSSGTPDTVSTLTHEDVLAFWSEHAGPSSAAVVVAGDIDLDEAVELARRHFGEWKNETQEVGRPDAPPLRERSHVNVVPKPGLNQTLIMMGRPAIPSGHPDEWALDLATKVFGGFFGSRLNMNLREARGYTYGARAWVDGRRGVGPLAASSSVRADVTGPALEEFFHELAGITQRPITDEELEAAREGIIRSVPGSFETVGGLAGAAAGLFWKDRPLDHYEKMIEGYESTDLDAVQAAAEKYFTPDRMQIVLVGDPETIRSQVAPLGLGELRIENVVEPATAP